MVRKQYLTLLELLISLGLTILLLSTLMGFYYQTVIVQKKVEESIEKNFNALYTHYRLAQIIPTIQQYLFRDESSLIFIFDNGTGKGPEYSVDILARLMLMDNGDLMLFTWPNPKRYPEKEFPMRKELLQTNVQSIKYEFLDPETKQRVPEWSIERTDLPLIIWINLNEKEEYAFVLPNAGHPILEGS